MADGLFARSRAASRAGALLLAEDEILVVRRDVARKVARQNPARVHLFADLAVEGHVVLLRVVAGEPRFAAVVGDAVQPAQIVIRFHVADFFVFFVAAEIRPVRRGEIQHRVVLIREGLHVAHLIQNDEADAGEAFLAGHIHVVAVGQQNQPLVADKHAVNVFGAVLRDAGEGEHRRRVFPNARFIVLRRHLEHRLGHGRRLRRVLRLARSGGLCFARSGGLRLARSGGLRLARPGVLRLARSGGFGLV